MIHKNNLPTGVKKRSGTKYIPFNDLDTDRKVISMLEFEGAVYVATEKGVYTIKDNMLKQIEFKENENG